MQRRHFLAASFALAQSPLWAYEPADRFDPQAWLKKRGLGKLTTVTPQSGKALQSIAANSLAEWNAERALYERALRELIGPWPETRPEVKGRVIEEKGFDKYVRFKVGWRGFWGCNRTKFSANLEYQKSSRIT